MNNILQVWKVNNYGKGVIDGSQDFYRITPDASGGGGAVDSVNGQTGVVVLDAADVGLGNVDNTSDANKPISTATQTALDTKTLPLIADDTTAVVTGVSVPTAFRSYLIPAGTLTNYNRLIMQMQVRKESGTGNGTVQIWVNNSNNFATATNIGAVTANNTVQFAALERKMIMRGTELLHINGTVNIASDSITSAQPWVSTAFNRANDIYVFVAVNPNSSTEVYTLEYFEMNARRIKTSI